MNTFSYLKLILKEELLAIKELLIEQRWLIIVLVCLLGALIYYLNPFPPRSISIAAGDRNGAYWQTAEKLSEYFKDNGVELELVESAGSLENAELLAMNSQNVRIAFLQGGSLEPQEASKFYSLGSFSYEPLWVFYRKNLPKTPETLTDISKLRLGVGPKLGGTQKLFKEVMKLNGVDTNSLNNLKFDSYLQNLEDFQAGKLDALVKVAGYHDEKIQKLLRDPDVGLLSIPDAVAYQKSLPYLLAESIPVNAVDIGKKIPPQYVSLISTTSSVIVDKTLHPDLQMLLLLASRDLQRSSQYLFFAKRGEFPAYVDPTIEASPTALHYYDYGVPPGMRYLPFWLAGFINRMWILILSIIAFTYPFAKLNFKLREIRYQIKHRRLYEELLGTELFLCEKSPPKDELSRIADRLKNLNREAINVRVPVGAEVEYFELLQAIELLRAKVKERLAAA
ncbi:MAG: TAXI family TRAP transporter solute-binding subunit [Fluviibacter sp.]